MLFNKRHAWKGEPVDTEGEMFTTWENTWTRNGKVVWGYDYTDPDFLSHMRQVYANLKAGGIKGLMFDYPASGWAKAGGMEDGNRPPRRHTGRSSACPTRPRTGVLCA